MTNKGITGQSLGLELWALEPVLELALVEQAGLELTEIRLPLPPEFWD